MSIVEEDQRDPQDSMEVSKDNLGTKAGNVEKIRDILFGTQMRDYEKRFTRLEERLHKETSELREDLKKRFQSLESYIKKELEAISERMGTEQNERVESSRSISNELKELAGSFEKKLSHLEEQASKNSRDLREQILEQSRNFSEEMRLNNEKLSSNIEKALADLRIEKVDRASLSNFLTEVAMRLTNEFKVEALEDLKDE